MISPLFIKIYTKQHEAIQGNVLFFQLCLEHLGFLVSERNFEVTCESHGGPDAFAEIIFFNHATRITIFTWHPFGVPTLQTTRSDTKTVAQLCEIENDERSFAEAYNRVHPLDAIGRDTVGRAYVDAVTQRIKSFGECLRENFDRL
jgi:hypothetical protein